MAGKPCQSSDSQWYELLAGCRLDCGSSCGNAGGDAAGFVSCHQLLCTDAAAAQLQSHPEAHMLWSQWSLCHIGGRKLAVVGA